MLLSAKPSFAPVGGFNFENVRSLNQYMKMEEMVLENIYIFFYLRELVVSTAGRCPSHLSLNAEVYFDRYCCQMITIASHTFGLMPCTYGEPCANPCYWQEGKRMACPLIQSQTPSINTCSPPQRESRITVRKTNT
ncbi:UNVERIFIED_CONTAM: hypothetical protein FKN15_045008 [Acipenser sinensis]